MTVDKAGTRVGALGFFNLFFCSSDFWSSNHPSARSEQILSALNDYQSKNLGWNGKLFVVGAYEGALPAIEIARQWSNVEGLVLLSIGSGLKDSSIFKKSLNCREGAPNQKETCTSIENAIASKLNEIYKSDLNAQTTWTIEGLTGTSKWFQEMLSFDLDSSLNFKLPPTLIIHGGRDYIVPSDTLQDIPKKHPEVELKIMDDLDQGWMDRQSKSRSQDVQFFVRDWIKKTSSAQQN
jgi:pimeloyl-ACP methyl ester carboxylesterase